MNFFFQAEDGIRNGHVTGVQTCALPISDMGCRRDDRDQPRRRDPVGGIPCRAENQAPESSDTPVGDHERSEERRVGKEWRVEEMTSGEAETREKKKCEGERKEHE